MESQNWAERFADQVRRLPLLVLLLLLSGVIAATGTVVGAADCLWKGYDDHFRWREHEYERISELRAGINVERYTELLGSPLFVRKNTDGSLTESSFKRRGYWVQTVHDDTGTVLLFSLTACDRDFQPTFLVARAWKVTLNRESLSYVPATPARIQYQWLTNTGNRNFWDEYYLGNPGFYKTYYVGIDDACASADSNIEPLEKYELFYSPTPMEYFEHPGIQEFRSSSVPNTYGEIAPFVSGGHPLDVDRALSSFQMGVDRILIRTVP